MLLMLLVGIVQPAILIGFLVRGEHDERQEILAEFE